MFHCKNTFSIFHAITFLPQPFWMVQLPARVRLQRVGSRTGCVSNKLLVCRSADKNRPPCHKTKKSEKEKLSIDRALMGQKALVQVMEFKKGSVSAKIICIVPQIPLKLASISLSFLHVPGYSDVIHPQREFTEAHL